MSSRPMLPEAEVMRIDLGGMVRSFCSCSFDGGGSRFGMSFCLD